MNRLFTLYLLRQIATAFAFASVGVTFVVLFTQSFRLLSLVIENSSTMAIFLQLMLLSALMFLPLIMPLALGVAIVFIYNRLATDSELVVMRATGMSPMGLIAPVAAFSCLVVAVCAGLTLWLTPLASRQLVSMQYQMRGSYAVFLAHPGSFNDLTDGLTFYANRRGPGGSLQGILIHDVRHPERVVTTMAASGQLVDADGDPRMLIYNGRRQEFDRATNRLSELAFDQYVLDLSALRNTAKQRFPDPRELRVSELLNPAPDLLRARGPMSRFRGELHSRLATPFLSFSYAMIGLATILVGTYNRRGMTGRILFCAVAMIIMQTGFMTLNGMALRDDRLTIALYMMALLPGLFGAGLLSLDFMRATPLLSRFGRGFWRKAAP